MSVITFFKDVLNGQQRSPNDLELTDMGLSRAEYHDLINSKDGTRARMEVLAARFGVTPAMIDQDRDLALELSQTCKHCQCRNACQNAIELGVEFKTERCPNATIYADMSST